MVGLRTKITVKMTVPMTLCQRQMIAFYWLSDVSDVGRMQGKNSKDEQRKLNLFLKKDTEDC